MVDQDVRQAAGEAILGGFPEATVSPEYAELLRSGRVGGAVLFRHNLTSCEQAAELTQSLKALRPDAWLAIDQEGGRVQRLGPPFPQLPPMRQLGERPDAASHVWRAGSVLSQGLFMLGFHQNYAPVLDVDTNPDNPAIGDRAFSGDPQRVAEFGVALIQALQTGGIAACGKHFPGHGDTHTDSHFELPRLDHDLDRLRRVELVPFAAAIRAGAASIMTTHVCFTALDAMHPTTLSEAVIEPLLRRELGYDGVVVTDDMEMLAIMGHYGIEEASVRALRAGCDQILICHRAELQAAAYEALVRAVETGELPRARLLQAAARISRMKQRYQPLAARLGALHQQWSDAWAVSSCK
ncbi:beta-N-acetylhexosaminidase [Candidatus Entotheonella palauensis]|nr:beta-N-acetylhexosaminidase [Candidatus Entotheonella palauensis]